LFSQKGQALREACAFQTSTNVERERDKKGLKERIENIIIKDTSFDPYLLAFIDMYAL